jgi:hypothetical protein
MPTEDELRQLPESLKAADTTEAADVVTKTSTKMFFDDPEEEDDGDEPASKTRFRVVHSKQVPIFTKIQSRGQFLTRA